MTNVHLTWEETVDPQVCPDSTDYQQKNSTNNVNSQACNTNPDVYEANSRDPARTPFPWDDTKNAGFSTGDKTWLPVGDAYKTNNVKAQEEATNSHLKIFRRLTSVRKQPVFRQGSFKGALTNNDNVYVYLRHYGNDYAIVALNFGKSTETVNVKNVFATVPNAMRVYTSSLGSGLANG